MLNISPLHHVPSASQVWNKTYFTGFFPWNDMTSYHTIEMSNLLLLLLCLYTLSYLGSSQNLHSTRFFTTSSPYHFFSHPTVCFLLSSSSLIRSFSRSTARPPRFCTAHNVHDASRSVLVDFIHYQSRLATLIHRVHICIISSLYMSSLVTSPQHLLGKRVSFRHFEPFNKVDLVTLL